MRSLAAHSLLKSSILKEQFQISDLLRIEKQLGLLKSCKDFKSIDNGLLKFCKDFKSIESVLRSFCKAPLFFLQYAPFGCA